MWFKAWSWLWRFYDGKWLLRQTSWTCPGPSAPFESVKWNLWLMHVCLCFFQRAKGRSRNMGKTSEETPRRNPDSSSLTSSVGLYMQYSKRTSARPKSYKSPSLSSWAWSSPPSATSLWTLAGEVSISGWMTEAPTQSTHPPALVPKRNSCRLTPKNNLRWKSFNLKGKKKLSQTSSGKCFFLFFFFALKTCTILIFIISKEKTTKQPKTSSSSSSSASI